MGGVDLIANRRNEMSAGMGVKYETWRAQQTHDHRYLWCLPINDMRTERWFRLATRLPISSPQYTFAMVTSR
jgi:hypothetical protein